MRHSAPLLLPRLGPAPAGRWWIAFLLWLSAGLLLAPASLHPGDLLPGSSEFPDLAGTVNYHWLVHSRGLLGAAHSRLLMYPASVDRLVVDGFPLDALASWPFLRALGWPMGFTLFQWAVLWAAGLGMASLSGRWWRSAAAAVVGGVAFQSAAVIVRELAYGRPTQVFAVALVPPMIALACVGLRTGAGARLLGAGALLALSSLVYWFQGFFGGLALVTLALLAWREGLPAWRRAAVMGAGAFGVLAVPVLYTLGGLGEAAGVQASLFSDVRHADQVLHLATLLERRDLFGSGWSEGAFRVQPLLWGLVGLGIWRAPVRRWLAPVVLIVAGLLLAMGPWVVLPGDVALPGPWSIVAELPVLRRLWWPDRALLIGAPGLCLLAAGGAARLSTMRWRLPALGVGASVGAALLAEAFLTLPTLPLPTTPGGPTAHSDAMAQGSGPALILPSASGIYRRDAHLLIEQVFHERPLVNGPMLPTSSTAPSAYAALRRVPAIAHLFRCESLPGTLFEQDATVARARLAGLGVTAVYLDEAVVRAAAAQPEPYFTCVQSLLGESAETQGPYRVWMLPSG